MLVLTRKVKQQIQIGENIVVTILHVRGQAVRVGIEAPRQVRVARSEIANLPAEEKPPAPEMTKSSTSRPKRSSMNCDDHFSSPLAERVTTVVESSASQSFVGRSFVVKQDEMPPALPLPGRSEFGIHDTPFRPTTLIKVDDTLGRHGAHVALAFEI